MTVPKAGGIKQRKLSRQKDKERVTPSPTFDDICPDTDDETTEHNDGLGGKFSVLPKMRSIRIWSRAVMMACAVVVALFAQNQDKVLSNARDIVDNRKHQVECSESYMDEIEQFEGCIPNKCGRGVMDRLLLGREVDSLLKLAKRGMALTTGSAGGASILDLHSGALSHGTNFINIYSLNVTDVISPKDFLLFKSVKRKVMQGIEHSFGLEQNSVHLTYPLFFSRLTSDPPVTAHDEYWHPHVDKETYESFHYTALLYFNDYGRDFKGGRFAFLEPDNSTLIVEPRKGRVLMFTSGAENKHYVERVKSGTRFAMTISFTCDKNKAITDPRFVQEVKKSKKNKCN